MRTELQIESLVGMTLLEAEKVLELHCLPDYRYMPDVFTLRYWTPNPWLCHDVRITPTVQ